MSRAGVVIVGVTLFVVTTLVAAGRLIYAHEIDWWSVAVLAGTSLIVNAALFWPQRKRGSDGGQVRVQA